MAKNILKKDPETGKKYTGQLKKDEISPAARPFKTTLTVTSNGQNMFLLPVETAELLASETAKVDSSLKVENAEYDFNTDYIFIQDGSDLYLKWVSTKFTLKIADKVELRR